MRKMKYRKCVTLPVRRELGELHLAVFLFGFAGLFGKLVNLPAMLIVLGRVVFASIFLYFVLILRGEKLRISSRSLLVLPLLGLLLAVHWSSFFYAIQLSTVAIGLITYSTFPIFTAILEPIINKSSMEKRNIFLAFLTFLGIVIMVPNFSVENDVMQGVIWGTLSGFTFSLLTIMNRGYVGEYSSLKLALYQDGFAAIFLVPAAIFLPFHLLPIGFFYLLILGVFFTGLAHTLFIHSLRKIGAQNASVIATLEPLYGIILALLLLGEVPSLRTVIGGAIVLSSCFYVTLRLAKFK